MRKFTTKDTCLKCGVGWIERKYVKEKTILVGYDKHGNRIKSVQPEYLEVWCHSCGYQLKPMQCKDMSERIDAAMKNAATEKEPLKCRECGQALSRVLTLVNDPDIFCCNNEKCALCGLEVKP